MLSKLQDSVAAIVLGAVPRMQLIRSCLCKSFCCCAICGLAAKIPDVQDDHGHGLTSFTLVPVFMAYVHRPVAEHVSHERIAIFWLVTKECIEKYAYHYAVEVLENLEVDIGCGLWFASRLEASFCTLKCGSTKQETTRTLATKPVCLKPQRTRVSRQKSRERRGCKQLAYQETLAQEVNVCWTCMGQGGWGALVTVFDGGDADRPPRPCAATHPHASCTHRHVPCT